MMYRLGRLISRTTSLRASEIAVGGTYFVTALLMMAIPFWAETQHVPPFLGYSFSAWFIAIVALRFLSEAGTQIQENRRRRDDVVLRKGITAQALDKLAEAILGQRLVIHDAQQRTLDAICDHVAKRIRQTKAGVISANLIVLEADDRMRVIARSGNTRPLGRVYHRSELFCVKALEDQKTVSVGDLRIRYPSDEKPYRDILAVPILGIGGDPPHFGVVSVDSVAPCVFHGRESDLGIGLAPYANVLRLTLLVGQKGPTA